MKRNEQQYDIPLKIFSYKELYGWTMDEIVREVNYHIFRVLFIIYGDGSNIGGSNVGGSEE